MKRIKPHLLALLAASGFAAPAVAKTPVLTLLDVVNDNPQSPLTPANGLLFGTTENGGPAQAGTIYEVDPITAALTTIYSFTGGVNGSVDAAQPTGNLLLVKGVLYGTSQSGGTAGNGAIYKFDPSTNTETVLYSFTGGNDGAAPPANGPTQHGTHLYGIAQQGGKAGGGTIWSYDIETGTFKTEYHFPANTGSLDTAGVVWLNGALYGAAPDNGSDTYGELFVLNGGKLTVLHSFTAGNGDGARPYRPFVLHGLLYGLTGFGGPSGTGTVFSYNTSTNTYSLVTAIGDSPGGPFTPSAAIAGPGGQIFGVARQGGLYDFGSLYSVDPATGALSDVCSNFDGNDPVNPLNAPFNIVYYDNAFYGISESGMYKCTLE